MKKCLIALGIFGVIIAISFVLVVNIVKIRGNELGVLETWESGLQPEPLRTKTHVLFPGFARTVDVYDMGEQVYVMNDSNMSEEGLAKGRKKGAYLVQSFEGQDLRISCNVTWRRNPGKIVSIHQEFPTDIEEKLLRLQLLSVIKNKATEMKAIDAYSGPGLVRLQKEIQATLRDENGPMFLGGIKVGNFVIERIDLDGDYIGQIKAKQVAVQTELRANQEQKAALAEAEKVKAEALADLNIQVVGAERDKQVGILDAEKDKQMHILAAEAEQQKRVLEATGAKDAEVLRAEGILAVGKAEAAAVQMKMNAYATPGSNQFVTMEVSKNLANAYSGVTGFIPEGMTLNLFADKFMSGLGTALGRTSE